MEDETGGSRGPGAGGARAAASAQTPADARRASSGTSTLRIASDDQELLERAAAEAYAAGAGGALEEPGALVLFVDDGALPDVLAVLAPFTPLGLAIAEPVSEPAVEWSEAWKRGLGPIVISPRLLVRPPFAPAPPEFSGIQLVIDPGQAFGTGGHATTRLALAGLDALPAAALRGARVLDVGSGSGVLALAALALGAAHALGCDLDPLATEAAQVAARENGLDERARWFTGSTSGLRESYDGIVANLLRTEMLPLLADFARLAKRGAWLVLAGLLVAEREPMLGALAAVGFRLIAERDETDATGDAWLGLTAERSA